MNFLAHLVLAPRSPKGRVGSIAPDLIRGPLPPGLDPLVLEAALEHRRIDRFTDRHPAFLRTRQRLAAHVDSRLAGVLADVVYDHVLASAWPAWRTDRLEDFVAEVEHDLSSHVHDMPGRMQAIVRKLVGEQWLSRYATTAGLCDRLDAMSRRLTRRFGRPTSLSLRAEQVDRLRPRIAEDFAQLWPDLLADVAGQRRAARLAS